jgi:hypothetical protein
MPKSDLVKAEPAMSLATATGLLGAVLTVLVTHGVLTDTSASTATQAAAPFVALLLPMLGGALVRRLVTPAGKVADVLEQAGLLTDADWARLEAVIEDKLGVDLNLPTGEDHPDAELVGAPAGQSLADTPLGLPGSGGMGAGSPDAEKYRAEHAADTSA